MSQIDDVKERTDIVKLISEYISLKKLGRNFKAVCPFHSEKTPSFVVSPERQIWHCFGCGRGGDVFAFLQEYERLDFHESLKLLAKRANVKLADYKPDPTSQTKDRLKQAHTLAAQYYNHLLTKHPIGEQARQYLQTRGLKSKIVDTFNLGYAPASWTSLYRYLKSKRFTDEELLNAGLVVSTNGKAPYDRFRKRLMFPVLDAFGQTVGFSGRIIGEGEPKYLNSPETLIFQKGRLLYGLNFAKEGIRKNNIAVLVEGNIDVVNGHQHGINCMVAPLGTGLTEEHAQLLTRYCETIHLAFDGDKAGVEAIKRTFPILESAGLNTKVVQIPRDQDPDDLMRKDPKKLKLLLEKPKSSFDWLINTLAEQFNLQEADNKQKAVDIALSFMTAIQSPVKHAHFIKKLSEITSVDESILLKEDALLKQKQNKQTSLKIPASQTQAQDWRKQKRREQLERYMITLMMHWKYFDQKTINALQKRTLSALPLEKIKQALTNYAKTHKMLEIETFYATLEPNIQRVADLLLMTELPNQIEENLNEQLLKLIKEFDLLLLQEEQETLSKKIMEAEKSQAHKELDQLTAEFDKLVSQRTILLKGV